MPLPLILVVEDDPAIATLIAAVLKHNGYRFELAIDGEAAIRRMRTHSYAAVILDLMLPKVNGFDVLQYLRAEQQSLLANVIVMTAAADRTLTHFDRGSVGAFLRKPFELAELVEAIAACVRSFEERALPGASPEPVDG